MVYALADGLAVRHNLRRMLLAIAATETETEMDTETVDNIALLGFIAQAASLFWKRGVRGEVNDIELTVSPAADTQEEADDRTSVQSFTNVNHRGTRES